MSQIETGLIKVSDESVGSKNFIKELDEARETEAKSLKNICIAIDIIKQYKTFPYTEALKQDLSFLRRGHPAAYTDFDQALQNLQNGNYINLENNLQNGNKPSLVDNLQDIIFIYKEMGHLKNGNKPDSKFQKKLDEARQFIWAGFKALNTSMM